MQTKKANVNYKLIDLEIQKKIFFIKIILFYKYKFLTMS